MSKTVSLADLVHGMKNMKSGEATQNWDVVVSYSVDKLNALLQSIWASNQTSQTLSPLTPHVDQISGDSSTIEWEIQLTSQTLSFTNDGQARLGMAISGRFRGQGTDTDGTSYPWHEVPFGSTFVAYVPLQFVSAIAGDLNSTDAQPGQQIITFGDESDANLYIVFKFDNVPPANYTIDCPSQYHSIFEPLVGELQKWMQFNISSIQYSLPSFAPTDTVVGIYLWPISMAFTVYTDGDNTCLSIYIQIKDSNNPRGNNNLPNSDGADALPVPSGYSASIIIRRDLFREMFLSNLLKPLQADAALASFYAAAMDTMSGISFDLHPDNTISGYISDIIVEGAVNHVNLSLLLDYSATTTAITPGKHVIDIDTSVGVLTPFDVLLVGNVASNA